MDRASTPPRPPAPRELAGAGVVAGATLLALLPFVDKALHIDDPFYVWVAQHVLAQPGDFFGLTVNWSGALEPLATVNKNPPLVSFFLAAVGAVVGWSERALHLAFLLPALGVTLATFGLARRWTADPVYAGLACLATPIFLVSATTVMSDVPMLALFCAALLCWVVAIDEERPALGWLAGGLAAACALTKYFGVTWVPLALVYGALRRRRAGGWLLPLALPLGTLFAYELYTASLYGQGLLGRAADYATLTRPEGTTTFERGLVAIVFAGGGLVVALPGALAALGRWGRVGVAAGGAAVAGICLARGALGGVPLSGDAGLDLNLVLHVVLFATTSAAIAAIAIAELRRASDAVSVLLCLWLAGTFLFSAFVNYTTNARTLLPMAPPLALLLARALASADGSRGWRFAWLLPGLAIALLVADADRRFAEASRLAARHLSERYAADPGTLWFEGTWGFQHYMQQAGARRVDTRRSVLRPGDWLVTPSQALIRLPLPDGSAQPVHSASGATQRITTMAQTRGSGFYAIQWGPLPYRLGEPHAERFDVRRMLRFVVFEDDAERLAERGRELAAAETAIATLHAWLAGGPGLAPRCVALVDALRAQVERRCRWCSTLGECEDCVSDLAGESGAAPACVDSLTEAWRAARARCTVQDATRDPLCREAERRRRLLSGEAPQATPTD